jgi:hypothetical protein
MKKVVVILTLVLITGLGCFASERREPCAKINQSRTITEAKSFLLQNGVYFDNLRSAYAESYNRVTGKNVPATKDGMEIIFQSTVLVHKSFVRPDEYENGVKVGNEVRFTNLVGAESDYWLAATDHNGNLLGVFGKVACMNPQRKKNWNNSGNKDGEKYIETIRIDTIKVRVVENVTYRDSIVNVEYVKVTERPVQVITVYSYFDNGNYRYDYGYTDYAYWGTYSFPSMYKSYCYQPQPCYSCNEKQERYTFKRYHRRDEHHEETKPVILNGRSLPPGGNNPGNGNGGGNSGNGGGVIREGGGNNGNGPGPATKPSFQNFSFPAQRQVKQPNGTGTRSLDFSSPSRSTGNGLSSTPAQRQVKQPNGTGTRSLSPSAPSRSGNSGSSGGGSGRSSGGGGHRK